MGQLSQTELQLVYQFEYDVACGCCCQYAASRHGHDWPHNPRRPAIFPAPKTVTATVFAKLPDDLHRAGAVSSWSNAQGLAASPHSSLEGPVFDLDGVLYCVDTAHGRIFKVDPNGAFTTVADYDGEPNGMNAMADGRLLVADYARGLVVINPATGCAHTVLDRHRAERFKAINDLTVASDGTVFFTDQALTGLTDPTGRVYRWQTDGTTDCLIDNAPSPNGLVLNAAETELFVAMTRANAVWRVPLSRGGVQKVGVFIQLSGGTGPDGLAMDEAGNLAVAHVGLGAVWLFSAFGEPILRIDAPQGRKTTNLAYGGPDRCTLYITESETGSILTASMPVAGRPISPIQRSF